MITRSHTAPRMSKITIHNETVYLCGQVGGAEGDVADQTRECLRRVEGLLAEAGSSPAHILQAVIWLADMSDFAAMNAVWDDWVPAGAARTKGRDHYHGGSGLTERTAFQLINPRCHPGPTCTAARSCLRRFGNLAPHWRSPDWPKATARPIPEDCLQLGPRRLPKRPQ